MNRRGFFFTAGVLLLMIPLLILIAYYNSLEQTKDENMISKIRCDELHFYVEDVREDMRRAMTIFGRRAAIYSIDDVIATGVGLDGYRFNCSRSCTLNCSQVDFEINGSQAAIAELMLCGTIYGSNSTYMVNHSIGKWLGIIEDHGSSMNFITSIEVNDIFLVAKDPFTFVTIINSTYTIRDRGETCYYEGENIQVIAETSILGLEDPIYPLNTGSFFIKQFVNCSTELDTTAVAGCSVQDQGNGTTAGQAIFFSQIPNGDMATYCSDNEVNITSQILVMDTSFGAAPCNHFEECCFNISCPNHFAGAINYDKNRMAPFVEQCDLTIPWITATGEMDELNPKSPGWDRAVGCDETYIGPGDCIQILNDGDCGLHEVRIGLDSASINTSCYIPSNASLYGSVEDGGSFFDRLDGNLVLSEKYRNQSIDVFNNSYIGLISLVNKYKMSQNGIEVVENRTWTDYLYFQGDIGCKAQGLCTASNFDFRLDDEHAKIFKIETECQSVPLC